MRRLGLALALFVIPACAGGESPGDGFGGFLPPVDAGVSTSTNPASTDSGSTSTAPLNPTPSGTNDAGVITQMDAGSVVADSGQTIADSGQTIADSGQAPADSGRADSGQTASDSGQTASDSGQTSASDTGVRPVDSGAIVVDAGNSDSGPDTGGITRGPAPTSQSASRNGPYRVQSSTQGFRNGPNFSESTLWWPTDAEPPFAIVAVVPGWVSTEADIREWGPFLASHGIVAMTAGTNDPLGDLPPDRKAALLDILVTLRAENTRTGGPLVGKLDITRQATMGWSMGGGGSLLAAEETPSLKAAISMCGWNPAYDASRVRVPSLMFASEFDPLAGGQSQYFYDTMPATTPKLIWEAPGGDHWLFNTPKNLSGAVGRYGLSWLKVYLEGDKRYLPFLKERPPEPTDFRHNL